MTAVAEPVRLTREIAGIGRLEYEETEKSRAYWLTPEGGKRRQRLPSVTTILREAWPKGEALLAWQAAQARTLTTAGVAAAREEATDRGKAVHRVVEHFLLTGGDLLDFDGFPYAWHGYLRGAVRFLWECEPEPIAVERLVCHPELRYAGRLDLIAKLAGRPTLLDFKSNAKGNVYEEAHVQAAGYFVADQRCGGDPIDQLAIVGISEDGDYHIVEVVAEARQMWHTTVEFYSVMQRFAKALP